MKKLFFAFVMLGGAVHSYAQTKGPVITWEKSVHDFGDVAQGDKVEHTFKFKNAGSEPLIITNVQVTCGCTTPKGWARDPIAPGQSSEITIAAKSIWSCVTLIYSWHSASSVSRILPANTFASLDFRTGKVLLSAKTNRTFPVS